MNNYIIINLLIFMFIGTSTAATGLITNKTSYDLVINLYPLSRTVAPELAIHPGDSKEYTSVNTAAAINFLGSLYTDHPQFVTTTGGTIMPLEDGGYTVNYDASSNQFVIKKTSVTQ